MAVIVGFVSMSVALGIFIVREVIEYIQIKRETTIKEKKKEDEKLMLLTKIDRSKKEMNEIEKNLERLRIKHSR